MKKNKKQSEKKKYTRMSNLIWAVKNIWKIDWRFCLLFLPSVPITVLERLGRDYFPKVLLDELAVGSVFARVLAVICVYCAAMLVLRLLRGFLDTRLGARRYSVSNRYHVMRMEKDNTTDCEHHEQQEYQRLEGLCSRDNCSGNAAVEFFWGDLFSFSMGLFGIFTYGSLMAMLHPLLLLVVVITTALSFIPARMQPSYTEKHKNDWEKESRKVGYLNNLSENFKIAKDIKLYDMTDWIEGMTQTYQDYLLMWDKRCSLRGFWASVLSGLLTLIQNGAAYIFLIAMLVSDGITVGDFVFTFGAVGSVAGFIGNIVNAVSKLMTRADKISYYREYLGFEEHFNHGGGCPLPPAGTPVTVELRDVWYKYDGAEDYTIKGLNLTIRAGEKLALVGMNGAGKTTLVKLICGFYMPTKGEILLNGQPIPVYNIEEYYSLISAVFQDIRIPAMTILRFVASVDEEGREDRAKAERALRDAGLWEKVASLPQGWDTYLGKSVYPDAVDLSGGETQKLLLARAIYKSCALLVLDEPTAALDPIAENELYLSYHNLTAGKTSVYISHRFASTRFCDRVVLLENGVITESGTHDELMAQNGQYAYMFGVQSKYYKEDAVHEAE